MSVAMELIERAQSGDVEAHAEIYERYRRTVWGFLWNKTQSAELADDLTQDTFVRAIRGIGRFSWQDKDPGKWLVTIARNLLTDHFRSAHQRHSIVVGDFPAYGIDWADTSIEGNPEVAALDSIRNADLRDALWHLTDDQRQCLSYRYLDQLSVAETAAVMGRKEGAIKALTGRAIQVLSRFLFRTVTA
jgi:RNA polymerase sigma-70 factor (ECF subfamily)